MNVGNRCCIDSFLYLFAIDDLARNIAANAESRGGECNKQVAAEV
jgi:hypothetical protein